MLVIYIFADTYHPPSPTTTPWPVLNMSQSPQLCSGTTIGSSNQPSLSFSPLYSMRLPVSNLALPHSTYSGGGQPTATTACSIAQYSQSTQCEAQKSVLVAITFYFVLLYIFWSEQRLRFQSWAKISTDVDEGLACADLGASTSRNSL